jgi:hypothetical protein
MEVNMMKNSNIELLVRVLDGSATCTERKAVLFNMSESAFEECFMVALRAMTLFNDNTETYETI